MNPPQLAPRRRLAGSTPRHRGVFEELSESDPRAPWSRALALKQRTISARVTTHFSAGSAGRTVRPSCGRGFARTSKSPAERQRFGSWPPAAWPSSLRALAAALPNAAMNNRSRRRRCGRLTWRFRTISWWRRTTTSISVLISSLEEPMTNRTTRRNNRYTSSE
jgi:hypothetical protein